MRLARNSRSVSKNRRGDATVLVIFIGLSLFLILFAIFNLATYKVFDEVNDFLQTDDDLSNSSKAVVGNLYDRYDETMDGSFVTVLALMYIIGMMAAWFASRSPAFAVIAIIIMIFILMSSMILGNVWEEYSTDAEYTGLTTKLTMTNWIATNYLLVSLTLISTMIMTMYFRRGL